MKNYILFKGTKKHFIDRIKNPKYQSQKELDLINYCKEKNRAIPKYWADINIILETKELPIILMQTLNCFILAADFVPMQDKVKQFHFQIAYGCRKNEATYNKLNNWIRSLKKGEWEYFENPIMNIPPHLRKS